jgi:hypothetical protein
MRRETENDGDLRIQPQSGISQNGSGATIKRFVWQALGCFCATFRSSSVVRPAPQAIRNCSRFPPLKKPGGDLLPARQHHSFRNSLYTLRVRINLRIPSRPASAIPRRATVAPLSGTAPGAGASMKSLWSVPGLGGLPNGR